MIQENHKTKENRIHEKNDYVRFGGGFVVKRMQ